ncbi:MAG: DUF1801 domain-containing protein [Anaerolineaceae bacterium]|nr:DUF1801 domain-containing protein [Anaerolineaceae bacterium]MBN2676944.1 DUF1801 domain-containing protein [Anaerolineaceae bacterium]
MLTTRAILTRFQYIDPRLMDIVIELRNLIAEVQPNATETIHRKGLTYYDASRGGHVSANICQIVIFDDHVCLAFLQGVFLPDPHHLLKVEGERIAKRFVDIHDYEKAPWEELKELVKASAAFNPYEPEKKPSG